MEPSISMANSRRRPLSDTSANTKSTWRKQNDERGDLFSTTKRQSSGFDYERGDLMTQEMLVKENDSQISVLKSQVGLLKGMMVSIDTEVAQQNKYLDLVESDIDRSAGIMKGVMKQVDRLSKMGGSFHLWYMVMFMVVVLVILWWTAK
eukprot:c3475_g1_i2.p1 GENE.c3475_g1_i2~~c3475_g1_i2.p1  ORF type:complete len:149 (+),score=18.67 c3475_g1_i2:96-542(+)